MAIRIWIGVVFMLAAGICGWTWYQDHPQSAAPASEEADETFAVRLDGSSAHRELGTVACGSRSVIKVALQNPTGQPVRVMPVRTSCECLHMKVPEQEIAGGEQVDAELVIDFANQPNYRGNLLLVAEGVSTNGSRLFTIQLGVSVR